MRICIPTAEDRGLESAVFPHFGSAPFFALVDVETGDCRTVANPSCRRDHGSCHHVAQIRPYAVDAVVCSGMGRRALAGLREQGIAVLLGTGSSVSGVLAECRANAARPLTDEEACGGRHGHGHGRHHAPDRLHS